MKKIAEIISLIFNPGFLILISLLLGIEKSNFSKNNEIIILSSAILLNGFLPAALMLYYSKKGIVIDDVLLNKEVLQNRSHILGWGAVLLSLEAICVSFLKKPEPIFAICVTLVAILGALFIITLYRKISLHAAGITFFSFIIIVLFGRSFWPVLFLIPIVVWSRLYLLRHTKTQLVAGFFVTLIITSLILYYFKLLP